MSELIRLDKFISQAAGIARSEAKRVIGKSWVKVNDEVINDASAKISLTDQVVYKRTNLSLPQLQYILMFKPTGYICSAIDEVHPSALNLLTLQQKQDLHFAGRLDADTSGAVLITDDGKWSHKVTSPRRKCQKTYRIWLAEPLRESALNELAAGIMLNGEDEITKPAKITLVDPLQVILTLTEGRYHQVKRMFGAVNNRVVRLHRESIGSLDLTGLKSGEWRALSASEIKSFS